MRPAPRRGSRNLPAQQDEIFAGALQVLQAFLATLDEQRVADAKREVAQVLAQVRPVAEDAEHDHTEPFPQTGLTHRRTVQARTRRDEDLREPEIHVRDSASALRIHGPLVPLLPDEIDDRVGRALDDQEVPGLQRVILEGRPDRLLATHELEEPDLRQVRHLAERAPHEAGLLPEDDLGHVVRAELLRQERGEADAIGQQPRGDGEQVHEPDPAEDQPHGKEVEESEGGQVLLLHETVHEEVGRGADEREGAAEDGRVGKRDEEPRGRHAQFGTHREEDRQQEHHDARVVHEAREDHDDRQDREEQHPGAASARALCQPVHGLDGAGLLKGLGEHEHAGDGEEGRRAEPRRRLRRVQHRRDAAGDRIRADREDQEPERQDGDQIERRRQERVGTAPRAGRR